MNAVLTLNAGSRMQAAELRGRLDEIGSKLKMLYSRFRTEPFDEGLAEEQATLEREFDDVVSEIEAL